MYVQQEIILLAELCFPLLVLDGALLFATDGDQHAHEPEVGKKPREQNSKTKEGAELCKKLKLAREERQ